MQSIIVSNSAGSEYCGQKYEIPFSPGTEESRRFMGLHSLVSLSRPILYFFAFAVREFPEKDDKEINHCPNSQAADGKELDDTRTHLASVETMGPENPEEEAKQRCQQSFFVTHLRSPFFLV
jgi:hypothetical protein